MQHPPLLFGVNRLPLSQRWATWPHDVFRLDEIPRLEVDPERGEVRLGASALDLVPAASDVAADAKLLDDFMHGYHSLFSGRVDELVQDYNAFTAWLLATPFMCLARDAALQHDHKVCVANC